MKQLKLLENQNSAYGGELLNTRKGRETGRPLDTRNTMHLVLRSSKARSEWSFRRPKNAAAVKAIIHKFANKYGIRILSLANVGNHLHMQVKLSNRFSYKAFIRAITSAIAMAVTGKSRWNKTSFVTLNAAKTTVTENAVVAKGEINAATAKNEAEGVSEDNKSRKAGGSKTSEKFWDYRPYSRVVKGLGALLILKDYIWLNQMEGKGHKREDAKAWIEKENAARAAEQKRRRQRTSRSRQAG